MFAKRPALQAFFMGARKGAAGAGWRGSAPDRGKKYSILSKNEFINPTYWALTVVIMDTRGSENPQNRDKKMNIRPKVVILRKVLSATF